MRAVLVLRLPVGEGPRDLAAYLTTEGQLRPPLDEEELAVALLVALRTHCLPAAGATVLDLLLARFQPEPLSSAALGFYSGLTDIQLMQQVGFAVNRLLLAVSQLRSFRARLGLKEGAPMSLQGR